MTTYGMVSLVPHSAVSHSFPAMATYGLVLIGEGLHTATSTVQAIAQTLNLNTLREEPNLSIMHAFVLEV